MTLPDEVKKFIRQYRLIDKKDKILIGLSGGPDSLCLLFVLNALQKEFGLRLYIAHLNHSLRGRESDQDQEFVKKLSGNLNMPAFFKKLNPASASTTCRSEEAARKVRYQFLFQTAKKNRLTKIALGHNQDDQAETVLMRLIRGSGLLGLAAILPKKKIGDFTLIRPLLGTKRKEIESFLRLKRMTPRRDSSNLKGAYFRNRLRHKLLPELEEYNPNIKEALSSTAASAAYDYDFLRACSLKTFDRIRVAARKRQSLPLGKFLHLHPAMQNAALRLSFEELKGDTRRLTFGHIRELRDLVYCRPTGSIVDLPSSISARKKNEFLDLYIRRKISS